MWARGVFAVHEYFVITMCSTSSVASASAAVAPAGPLPTTRTSVCSASVISQRRSAVERPRVLRGVRTGAISLATHRGVIGDGMRNVSAMSEVEHFDFAFAPAYRSVARLFGIRPATAWVEVGDERLEARFGPWRVATPLANVADAMITGPYAFFK